jgi:hypothetical protein
VVQSDNVVEPSLRLRARARLKWPCLARSDTVISPEKNSNGRKVSVQIPKECQSMTASDGVE